MYFGGVSCELAAGKGGEEAWGCLASAGPVEWLGTRCLTGGTGLCLGWKNGWTRRGVHADEDPEAWFEVEFLAVDTDLVGV